MPRPESNLFFGVELAEFHDWSEDVEDMPYDYGWEERFAAKLEITQDEGESSLAFNARIREETGITLIDAGDDNHETLTIGITDTVVNCDWDAQAEIPIDNPIWRFATKGEGIGGDADLWVSKIQRFCDAMLNVKVDIKQLYREGKVGWRLSAYYPSS